MSSSRLLRASSQAPGIHHFSTCSSFWVRNAEMKCTPINNPHYNRKSYSTVAMVATAPSESLKTSSSDQMTTPSEPWGSCGDIDLVSLVKMVMVVTFKPAAVTAVKSNKFQILVERAIFDCRFFAILAVVGSLVGSVLCFIEGCLLVAECYIHYLHTLTGGLDKGHMMMKLLIEAIDMYLLGTAMLVFGVGIHAMFVDSMSKRHTRIPDSNLFGLFHLKHLPAWMETRSISEAKSRIGHAVVMILQVGLVEKFKSVPLITSFDLACFAAAILVSSASTFLLSKLYTLNH
ncbi:hypothetical protein LINPERPRIM_LOCUS32805 [Linum perenne]